MQVFLCSKQYFQMDLPAATYFLNKREGHSRMRTQILDFMKEGGIETSGVVNTSSQQFVLVNLSVFHDCVYYLNK
jgi:hypothetical protein